MVKQLSNKRCSERICSAEYVPIMKILGKHLNKLKFIQDRPFRSFSRIGPQVKRPTLPKICHTFYNDESWYSNTLLEKDTKNI